MAELGKTLIIIGAIAIVIGALLMLSGKIPWLGRLPGDISIKNENFSFYFPLTTCILISLAISLLLWFFRK
jgi:hypothetical protein